MSYITNEYYLNEYGGTPPVKPEELTKNIKRASETIDMITGHKLNLNPTYLDETHPFVKAQVQKATAAMTEFYIINGGYEMQLSQQMDDVSIGSFRYSMRADGKNIEVPSIVVSHLTPTGLLYAGINVSGGGVYYDN